MSNIINLLTICRKAGKLVMGFDASKEALQSAKVHLIILASDISPKTEKEINFFSEKARVKVLKSNQCIEEFYIGIGKKVGILSICDEGFAKKLETMIEFDGKE